MTRIALVASALVALSGCGDFESTERRAHLSLMAANLEAALERFDRRDYDGCIAYCQVMLSKDPAYLVAQELAEDAAMMKERCKYDYLKRLHVREIADILLDAIGRFDERDFDGCIAYCKWILTKEPHYWVAEDLAEEAEKVKTREHYYDFLRAKVENWRKSTSTDDEAKVPYAETLTYPHLLGFATPAD